MNALSAAPVNATPVACISSVAIAQRIANLLREREANQQALSAVRDRFKPSRTPAPTIAYRGPLGPIQVDIDPEWIRELLPKFSRHSPRGRRLRRLLRLHEEHRARMWADREASGLGQLVDENVSIEGGLEAAATEARSLGGHSIGHIALQAASLLALKIDCYRDSAGAPAVLRALLEAAGADTTGGLFTAHDTRVDSVALIVDAALPWVVRRGGPLPIIVGRYASQEEAECAALDLNHAHESQNGQLTPSQSGGAFPP
jgi:hypothetical protein